MTITVETGGPLGTTPPVLDPTTFANLAVQIADEIDDTTDEYAGQIQSSIYQAIRWCEREVYYFNETRDVTFPTVEGQEWYGGDHEQIPRLVRIVAAYSERPDGERYMLRREMPDTMELLADNTAARGEPYSFTYFDQKIRLYPIPDATVYTIRLQLGPYRLAPITATNEANAWTTEAYDMVRAMAKHILYRDILKDDNEAAKALAVYQAEHEALKAETSRRNGRGVIIATCF